MSKQTVETENMTDSRLNDLHAQLRAIDLEIENIQKDKRLKESAALVGRAFKFRNSYSGSPFSWWLYVKVTQMDADGYLKGLFFETDCNSHISIRENTFHQRGDVYEPITIDEFDSAFAELKARVSGLKS